MVKKSGVSDVRRTAIVVLGMHRSGTSALTRVLSQLGCTLPKTLIGSNHSNDLGHWESQRIAAFNEGLLVSSGSAWDDYQTFRREWLESPAAEGVAEQIAGLLTEEFGDARLFVLKDPRLCRLMPVWLSAFDNLNITLALVIPFRNPLEVAASLHKRDGMNPNYAQILWLRYMLDLEAATRGRPRSIIAYDRLLADWPGVAESIGETFDLTWPRGGALVDGEIDAFLDAGRKHHHSFSQGRRLKNAASDWIGPVWAIFSRWEEEGEAVGDYVEIDAIREAFDAASPHFARVLQGLIGELRDGGEARQALARNLEDAQLHQQGLAADRLHLLNEREAWNADRSRLEEKVAALVQQQGDRTTEYEQLLAERQEWLATHLRLEVELDQLRASHDALEQARASDRHEHDCLVVERAQLLAEREQLLTSIQRARTDEATLQNELDDMGRVLERVRQRGDTLDSALAQKCEEAEQVWHDLEATRAMLAEKDTALEQIVRREDALQSQQQALANRLAAAEGWVFQLSGQLRAAALRAEQAEKALGVQDAELRQARMLVQVAEAGLVRQRDGHDHELALLDQTLRDATDHVRALESRLDLAQQDLQWLGEQATTSEAERQAASQRACELEDRLAQERAISGVAQQSVELSQWQIAWLQSVSVTLLNTPWWWNLLPAEKKQARIWRKLARSGLFDAASYLGRYPDVALDGGDPLTHFINHGMAEGREPL